MGSSLPTFERQTAAERQGSNEQEGTPPPADMGWSLRLSLSQVIVLWSVMAGILVMSFLFGMYAGREQGVSSALEEYRGQAVRIQVAEPIASEANREQQLAALDELNSEAGEEEPPAGAAGEEDEPKFDFSPEGKLTLSVKQPPPVKAAPAEPPAKPKEPPAKSKEPKTVETPKSAKDSETLVKLSTPGPGWYVQVAATKDHSQASQVYNRFKSSGFSGVLERARVQGLDYYRVILGPYSSRAAALAAKSKITNAGIGRAEPFLKRVR